MRAFFAVMAATVFALAVASPAQADTALPTPGTPVASDSTTTSITFSWSASPRPVANYTIQLITGWTPWTTLATTASTSYTHTGLSPDTVYQYRIIANPIGGSGYTASNPSGILNLRTQPLPDSVAPTAARNPYASLASTIRATIGFGASTDNNRVAGYWVQHQVDGVWTDWATNNINTVYLDNLTPGTTYTVAVVAFDANGNRSPQSPPLTFTTRATQPHPTCKVQFGDWGQTYLLYATLENMTAATNVTNWTVSFAVPAGHVLGSAFNATTTRVGDRATMSSTAWNTTLSLGSTITIGINGNTRPAGAPLPYGFTFHSNAGSFPCTV